MPSLENFTEPMYNIINSIGNGVIRLPIVSSFGVSNTKAFSVGLFVVFLVIFLVYCCMPSSKSGLMNTSTIRFNVQNTDYNTGIINTNTTFSESKLDDALMGY